MSFASFVVRRRRLMVLAWLIGSAALAPLAGSIEQVLGVAARRDGMRSSARPPSAAKPTTTKVAVPSRPSHSAPGRSR